MDIWKIITLVATTGIVSSVLTQLFVGTRESRKRKAQAGYHALRLAVVLEAYAYACANFINKNRNAQTPPDREFPDYEVELPELPPYPDDPEGWQAIELKLATRALNMRNRIAGSQGFIFSVAEYTEHELDDTLDEHAAGRGLEAWNIAVDLRRRYGLEPVELIWDFVDSMHGTLRAAVASSAEARKQNDAMVALATRACLEEQKPQLETQPNEK